MAANAQAKQSILISDGLAFGSYYSWEEVKVIAYIDAVSRVHHTLRPSGSIEEGYDLYFETTNGLLEIKGKCIAMGLTEYEY